MKCSLAVRWYLSPVNSVGVKGGDPRFWKDVYISLKKANRQVAQRYNQGLKVHNFRVGDTVIYRLTLISSKARDRSAKIMLRLSKPCTMAEEIRPNLVLLVDPNTGIVVRRANISQLKRCVI